jgi:hypothetical protein
MQSTVAHEAVSCRDDNRLQHAVPSGQGPCGYLCLLVLQQRRASLDGRSGGLAAQSRGRDLHTRVVLQAPSLPCLAV